MVSTHLCGNCTINWAFSRYTIMIDDHGSHNILCILNPFQCFINLVTKYYGLSSTGSFVTKCLKIKRNIQNNIFSDICTHMQICWYVSKRILTLEAPLLAPINPAITISGNYCQIASIVICNTSYKVASFERYITDGVPTSKMYIQRLIQKIIVYVLYNHTNLEQKQLFWQQNIQ